MLGFWRKLLGQNVIELADTGAVCETIALTIGLGEDAIDLDAGLADLADVGSTAGSAVSRALAVIGAGHGQLVAGSGPAALAGPDSPPAGAPPWGGTLVSADAPHRSDDNEFDLPSGNVRL